MKGPFSVPNIAIRITMLYVGLFSALCYFLKKNAFQEKVPVLGSDIENFLNNTFEVLALFEPLFV